MGLMTWRCPRQVCRTSKNGKNAHRHAHHPGLKNMSLGYLGGQARSSRSDRRLVGVEARIFKTAGDANWESRSERKQQYHILSPNTLTVAAAHYVQGSLGCRTHSQPHHLSRAQRVLLYTLNPWSAQSPLFCNLSMRKHTPNAQHSATLAAYLGRDDVDLLCKALDEHSVSFI